MLSTGIVTELPFASLSVMWSAATSVTVPLIETLPVEPAEAVGAAAGREAAVRA